MDQLIYRGDLAALEAALEDGSGRINRVCYGSEDKFALHLAVCGNHFDIAKLLLKNGAHVNSKASGVEWGQRASYSPIFSVRDPSLCKLLLEYGATTKHQEFRNRLWGPIGEAGRRGDFEVVRMLIVYGGAHLWGLDGDKCMMNGVINRIRRYNADATRRAEREHVVKKAVGARFELVRKTVFLFIDNVIGDPASVVVDYLGDGDRYASGYNFMLPEHSRREETCLCCADCLAHLRQR